jgi:transposase-like protein
MTDAFKFKTLAEFLEYFPDEKSCVEAFTKMRFRNGEYCPHCGHSKIHLFSNGKRYRCAKCKKDFTIRTNSAFGESKLPLRKWFIAIYLLSTMGKGISSVQLGKQVGVPQNTAWFMAHRIRSTKTQGGRQLFKRGYHGVYHHMSKKHMQRYVDEYTFRFNRRAREMQSVFADVVMRVSDSAKLPYKQLTAGELV